MRITKMLGEFPLSDRGKRRSQRLVQWIQRTPLHRLALSPSYPPLLTRCALALAWTKDARVLDTLHGLTSSEYKDIECCEFMALLLKFLHRYTADFQSLTDLRRTIGGNITRHMDPGPQNKMLRENPIALPQQDTRMHK